MKKYSVVLVLLVMTNQLLFAQNDRNILKYSITPPGGITTHITFTITEIGKERMILNWVSSEGKEGAVSLPSVAWKIGTSGFWQMPIPNDTLLLKENQTIASFSQDFYAQIKQKGEAQYDGIKYTVYTDSQNRHPVIGNQIADAISLRSADGNINFQMLDNPGIPLILKAENIVPGYTIELEDLSTFFFWEDVRNFKELPVPAAYLKTKKNNIPKKIKAFKDATEYLPVNFVRDGSVDYTEFLQKCLDVNKKVLVPDFPVLVNDNGLNVRSNQTIFFPENSKLILKPSDKQNYEILNVRNVKNVRILNANIVGDRDNHIGIGGEWGMGIGIRGSQNVTVKNANISDCWGDGIYVGRLEKLAKNIRIENCFINNVRRNGLSVISGVNLKVTDCVFANTNGTDPQCGVDIEPNNTQDVLRKIKFDNNIFFNNKHSGLLIYLNESPKKNKRHKVSIQINNSYDDNSLNPFRISGFSLGDKTEYKPMKGQIELKNFTSKDNKPGVVNKNELFPPIMMK